MTYTLVYTYFVLCDSWHKNCCVVREFCHNVNSHPLPFSCSNSHSHSSSRIPLCSFPSRGIPAGETGIVNSRSQWTPLVEMFRRIGLLFECIRTHICCGETVRYIRYSGAQKVSALKQSLKGLEISMRRILNSMLSLLSRRYCSDWICPASIHKTYAGFIHCALRKSGLRYTDTFYNRNVAQNVVFSDISLMAIWQRALKRHLPLASENLINNQL